VILTPPPRPYNWGTAPLAWRTAMQIEIPDEIAAATAEIASKTG
jgi:hypothetical protein